MPALRGEADVSTGLHKKVFHRKMWKNVERIPPLFFHKSAHIFFTVHSPVSPVPAPVFSLSTSPHFVHRGRMNNKTGPARAAAGHGARSPHLPAPYYHYDLYRSIFLSVFLSPATAAGCFSAPPQLYGA